MYVIQIGALRRGDIILSRNNSDLSQFVRRITKSEYSHAAIVVGFSSLIESDGPGVNAQNISRLIFENIDDACVLRAENLTETQERKIEAFARLLVGTEYSTQEARKATKIDGSRATEPNRQFCTRFVAQAFNSAGIPIVANPDYCTPLDLQHCTKLKSVPGCIELATDSQISFGKDNSAIDNFVEVQNAFLSQVRKLTGHDIQTFQQMIEFVLMNQQYDKAISDLLQETGYTEYWKTDIIKNPGHYDYEELKKQYPDKESRLEFAVGYSRIEPDNRRRFCITRDALLGTREVIELDTVETLVALYSKLIELSDTRLSIAKKCLRDLPNI